ncbi:MAG TPA: hypothetical protein PLQ19_02360 [Aeromicrobium sp.]|nr:hypothetical protein [Aeromicrobium sp.]
MKKSLVALVAAVMLVGLSACGGSADSAGSEAKAKDAETVAAPAKDDPLTKENFVERLSAAQLKAKSAQMKMTTSAGGSDMTMNGVVGIDEDVTKSKTKLTLDMGTGKMEVRMVDGMMYLSMGELTGNKFIKIDLNDPKDPLRDQYGSLADQADPEAQLKVFRDALVKFDNQGKDGGQIDGVDTTRIVMVLDTSKVLKGKGDEATKALGQMPKELEYVIYVGPDDLMRRMTMTVAKSDTTIDWSNWGEPVDVKAPSKDQITDASSLMSSFGS